VYQSTLSAFLLRQETKWLNRRLDKLYEWYLLNPYSDRHKRNPEWISPKPVEETDQPGLCLLLKDTPRGLPVFTTQQITRLLGEQIRRLESWLPLGAYHFLLPPGLRRRSLIEQFNIPRFVGALEALSPEAVDDEHAARLIELLA
jgi:hypothetical protein